MLVTWIENVWGLYGIRSCAPAPHAVPSPAPSGAFTMPKTSPAKLSQLVTRTTAPEPRPQSERCTS